MATVTNDGLSKDELAAACRSIEPLEMHDTNMQQVTCSVWDINGLVCLVDTGEGDDVMLYAIRRGNVSGKPMAIIHTRGQLVSLLVGLGHAVPRNLFSS